LSPFTGGGVEGKMARERRQLHGTAQLGLLLGAMKGPIEAEIRRVLEERFR